MLYSVSAQTDVLYFHGIGCPHCAIVADSGVLEKVGNISGVNLVEYEVYWDVKGQEKYNEMKELLNLPAGIPLAIVNYSGELYRTSPSDNVSVVDFRIKDCIKRIFMFNIFTIIFVINFHVQTSRITAIIRIICRGRDINFDISFTIQQMMKRNSSNTHFCSTDISHSVFWQC